MVCWQGWHHCTQSKILLFNPKCIVFNSLFLCWLEIRNSDAGGVWIRVVVLKINNHKQIRRWFLSANAPCGNGCVRAQAKQASKLQQHRRYRLGKTCRKNRHVSYSRMKYIKTYLSSTCGLTALHYRCWFMSRKAPLNERLVSSVATSSSCQIQSPENMTLANQSWSACEWRLLAPIRVRPNGF